MKERSTEILIVGAGTGGVAAALAAARLGKQVILTEETDWVGGQLTAQAVPPDEHPWIETTGHTRSYRLFREKVRSYYWRNYPMTEDARANTLLNPGNGNVSRLCHEPQVALAYRGNAGLPLQPPRRRVAASSSHRRGDGRGSRHRRHPAKRRNRRGHRHQRALHHRRHRVGRSAGTGRRGTRHRGREQGADRRTPRRRR
ncbi:MAG: FAD-dependent oxidoreductase [Caldilineaceae bacterium]